MVLDAEGAEQLTPPGDALVLMGHRIIRISTPYFKAPAPEEDTGDEDDLRLVGLSPDARAAFVAIEDGCNPTVRAVVEHFHWGDRRARHALKQLRMVGLLEASTEDEEASNDEENNGTVGAVGADGADGAVVGVVGVVAATENEPRLSFLDSEGTESTKAPTPTAEADAQAVIEAINNGACKATRRAVEKHFHWGTRRASAALRAAREFLDENFTAKTPRAPSFYNFLALLASWRLFTIILTICLIKQALALNKKLAWCRCLLRLL